MNVNKVAYIVHQLAVALAREDAEQFDVLRENLEEDLEELNDRGVIGNGAETDVASWDREVAAILETSTVA